MTAVSTKTANYSWWMFSALAGWRPFPNHYAKGLQRGNVYILIYFLPLAKGTCLSKA